MVRELEVGCCGRYEYCLLELNEEAIEVSLRSRKVCFGMREVVSEHEPQSGLESLMLP